MKTRNLIYYSILLQYKYNGYSIYFKRQIGNYKICLSFIFRNNVLETGGYIVSINTGDIIQVTF